MAAALSGSPRSNADKDSNKCVVRPRGRVPALRTRQVFTCRSRTQTETEMRSENIVKGAHCVDAWLSLLLLLPLLLPTYV